MVQYYTYESNSKACW